MKNFEFTENVEMEIKAKIFGYRRGRPAPASGNPSCPFFSDFGDDPEWRENEFYFVLNGQEVKIKNQNIIDYLEGLLIEEIIERGEI